MKRPKKDTFDYSPIALRALTRHKFAPASVAFTDKKKQFKRNRCRKNESED